MGYKGERASLNQYTPLKQYLIDSGAVDQLKRIFSLTEKFRESVKNDKADPGELIPTRATGQPFEVMAFDAGLARFFKDSPYEVVALKIAGGASPLVTEKFRFLLEASYAHVFTGLAKNPRVFKAITKKDDRVGASTLAAREVSRLFDDGVLKDLDVLMNETFGGDFRTEIETWIQKTTKTPELDNLAREFAEWFYIIRAAKCTDQKEVLIVKDGSLITNQFGSGEGLALRLQSLFRGEIPGVSPLIVGVVKESRFIKDEGHVVSRAIWKFARNTKGDVFFKIPQGLESLLDATTEEAKTVDRYFLSISSGRNVFEVQFPKAVTNNPDTFNRARMTILSQITSLYGGSIISNSIAHEAASLSEAEAQALEKHIRNLVEVKDEGSR